MTIWRAESSDSTKRRVTSRASPFPPLFAEMLHDVEPKVGRVFESTACTTT